MASTNVIALSAQMSQRHQIGIPAFSPRCKEPSPRTKSKDRRHDRLDQPIGMLGNKTPRQAAKSAAGRRKVAEWHKYLENQAANQLDPGDPVVTYSFEWMWEELGVQNLRR